MWKKRKEKIDSEVMDNKYFRVAIFGSARMGKRDMNYKMVYSLASMIGDEGMDVVTGSGPGVMKAANSGHVNGKKGNDAYSFGVAIKLPSEQKPNRNVDVLHNFDHFVDRLEDFVLLSDIFVVAPGGVGTLLEFFYVWQLVQVGKICPSKIILLGDFWPSMLKWLEKNPLKKKYFNKADLKLLNYAKNEKEAFEIINPEFQKFKKGGGKVCDNLDRYMDA